MKVGDDLERGVLYVNLSVRCRISSMNAVDKVLSGVHAKERQTAMEQRRCRLRKLLNEENEIFQVSLTMVSGFLCL